MRKVLAVGRWVLGIVFWLSSGFKSSVNALRRCFEESGTWNQEHRNQERRNQERRNQECLPAEAGERRKSESGKTEDRAEKEEGLKMVASPEGAA